MNDLAKMAMKFEGKNLTIKHIPGPEGVRGRNSDNTLIKQKLGWEPSIKLEDGMRKLYFWMKEKIEQEKANGVDTSIYGKSKVVENRNPEQKKD